jgi:GNAT superfamily N-acetyltransferase
MGNLLGTVRLDLSGDSGVTVGTVRLVAVLPEYQRQGVGTAMMNELEKFAIMKGVQRLHVNAAFDAVAFYHKLGWDLIDATRRSPFFSKTLS